MAKTKKHKRAKAVSADQKSQATKQNKPTMGAFAKPVLSWYAPEFLRYKRGWLWYAVAFLLNAALVGYALWSGSITMAIVFIVLPLVFMIDQRKKPQVVDVIISQYGVKFGLLKFPFSDMKSFWILHDPPYVDELHIQVKNRMHPEVTIPLAGVDPAVIRQYLVTQIPEKEGEKQSLMDIITRMLKLH
jgi:hypothetical protein